MNWKVLPRPKPFQQRRVCTAVSASFDIVLSANGAVGEGTAEAAVIEATLS